MALQVTTVSMGDNNVGTFGPDSLSQAQRALITIANADPQYEARPSNKVICVDGRCSAQETATANDETDVADIQLPGGLPVTETATEFMRNPNPAPVSVNIRQSTEKAVAVGIEVVMHGPVCAASQDMRQVLQENAANIDIVVPTANAVIGLLELQDHVTDHDLIGMVITGKNNADKDELFDTTAQQNIDISVAAGGIYVALEGQHLEGKIRVNIGTSTFHKAKFVQDISASAGTTIQQFAASLGAYKAQVFERAAMDGISDKDAALQVAGAVLGTIGIGKHLSTEAMDIDIVL